MKDSDFDYKKKRSLVHRKWWFLLVVAITALAVAGCTGTEDSDSAEETTEEADDSLEEDDSESEEALDSSPSEDSEEYIAEQVLYDQNDIVITATGITDITDYNYQIELLVENGSDSDIDITPEYGSVNGYMTSMSLYCEVPSGRESYSVLRIDLESLEEAGIETVMEIEFCFEIQDTEDWTVLDFSDPVTLTTGAYGSETQEYDDSGTMLYEENGVEITFRQIKSDDEAAYLDFYFENDSGQNISISTVELTINGYTVNGNMFCSIMDGKKADDYAALRYETLSELGIADADAIEQISISFNITDTDSGELIATTETFTISLQDGAGGESSATAAITATTGQTIYSENNIVITVAEMGLNGSDYEVTLQVQNSSESAIDIASYYGSSSVNGYMMDLTLNRTVEAGATSDVELTASAEDLDAAGIETVLELEFCLELTNASSNEEITLTDPIILTTEAYGTAVQAEDDSGTICYDDGSLKILYRYAEETSDASVVLVFCIDNESGQDIWAYLYPTAVNGTALTDSLSYTSCTVLNGKQAVVEIEISTDMLEDLGISDLDAVTQVTIASGIADPDTLADLGYEIDDMVISLTA